MSLKKINSSEPSFSTLETKIPYIGTQKEMDASFVTGKLHKDLAVWCKHQKIKSSDLYVINIWLQKY